MKLAELRDRIVHLEHAIGHLLAHHDEEYLVIHDDASEDLCRRLYTKRKKRK
jgi:hypothetical protein